MKRALSSFLMILISAAILGCSGGSAPAPAAPPVVKARLVRSVQLQEPQSIASTGTLHAKETAILAAQVPGQIRRVMVQPGDSVRAGQVLATLDSSAMQAALNQAVEAGTAATMQQKAAQQEAALAAETLRRYRILQQQNSVSPQEFDEVEKRSQAAQLRLASYAAQSREAAAAVTAARTQLAYATLRAPFRGIVTARLADPGTLAMPGTPVLQVDRDGPLQVYTSVDEAQIAGVSLGMKVPVLVDGAAANPLTGTVSQIVPAADPASRSFVVKLDLAEAKRLRAGMYVTVEFPGAARPMILAPQSAVVLRGSLECVYALDAGGVAQLRYVTLGSRHGQQVEILSGLAAGETLVDSPGDDDLAGKRIEAQP